MLMLMIVTDEPMDRILFKVIAGFATCGLSVGLSPELPPAGKYILAALMFAGRLGPITFAAALALRQRDQLYRYPTNDPSSAETAAPAGYTCTSAGQAAAGSSPRDHILDLQDSSAQNR